MPENLPQLESTGKKLPPLYMRMYFQEAYAEFVRFIGYAGKPLEEAHAYLLAFEKKARESEDD